MHYELTSIDPGKRECALACFAGARLFEAFELDPAYAPSSLDGTLLASDRVVWEVPQADGRGVPTADIIALTASGAGLARWVAGACGEVSSYEPRKWKGSVPKPVHHSRLWAVLDKRERDLLGGAQTRRAIENACKRGGADGWRKSGKLYYYAREFPCIDGVKITHDILDAVALGCFDLGRMKR